MSRTALQHALNQSLFMTGHLPEDIVPVPSYGELRSYLPPTEQVTRLALSLYIVGVTPWSWMREPDWLEFHDVNAAIDIAATKAHRAAGEIMGQHVGLMEAVMEAELLARESGKRLYDPHTMQPLFPDEEPSGDEMLIINPELADDLRSLH